MDDGVPDERVHSVSHQVLTSVLKSSHYLVWDSFVFDHRAMCTYHAVLDYEACPNHVHSDVLPIGWRQNLITSAHLPQLGDANGLPPELLGVVFLRLRLGNTHFQVTFIVVKRLDFSMSIGTDFLDRHIRAIRCIVGIFETTLCTVRIIGRNKATIYDEKVHVATPKLTNALEPDGTKEALP